MAHAIDTFCLLAGITQEQLGELRSRLKSDGIGQQGRSRTPQQNAVALRHVAAYSSLGLSLDASIKTAAAAECASAHTLRVAFTASGALSTRTPVDRSNPLHPFHSRDSGPSLPAQLLIHKHLHAVSMENTFESCNTSTSMLQL